MGTATDLWGGITQTCTRAVVRSVKAAPKTIKQSAVEGQAAVITWTDRSGAWLSEAKRQTAATSEMFGDGVALQNLGRRDGEAPVVPSLERVWGRVSSVIFITSSIAPVHADLFIVWWHKPGVQYSLLDVFKTNAHRSFVAH